MTEQVQLLCKMCNLMYDEKNGRLHGSFTCHTCAAADRALRRNLGERSEVQEFSREETYTFFRKVKEAKEESLGKATAVANVEGYTNSSRHPTANH